MAVLKHKLLIWKWKPVLFKVKSSPPSLLLCPWEARTRAAAKNLEDCFNEGEFNGI